MEEIGTSKAQLRRTRFSSRPHQDRQLYCVPTIASASGMIPTIWYIHREDRRKRKRIDLDPEQLTTITQIKEAELLTTSRRLDAVTHCESRVADSQGFRTGRIFQKGGDWALLQRQRMCYGWKQFHFLMHRILKKELSKFKITSSSQRSREARASDRNLSIRICRSSGYVISWVRFSRGMNISSRQLILGH